jgi:hypothetical protein
MARKAIAGLICLHYSVRHERKRAEENHWARASKKHAGGRLVPREFVVTQKQGGKVFEHKRKDVQPRSILKALDQLLEDIPNPGEPVRTNLARIIIEDRE